MPVSSRLSRVASAPAAAAPLLLAGLALRTSEPVAAAPLPLGGLALRTSEPVAAAAPRRDGLGISVTGLLAMVLLALIALGGIASTAHAAGNTISGTVRDANGTPLAGIEVTAFGESRYTIPARTSASGTYTVPLPSVGESWVIYAKDPSGHYSGRAWPDVLLIELGTKIAVADGADVTGIDVQMPLGARVHGVVRDQAGDPVSGALTGAKLSGDLLGESSADADGTFEWYGLPPGEWTFGAMGDIGSPLGLTEVKITLAPGQVAEVNILLKPKFAPVSPPGAPLTPSLTPAAPQAGGVAPPLGESAPIIVAPLKGRVAVSASGTLTRAVRCLERSHCGAAITVTTAATMRVAKGKPKARVVIAKGVVDTTTIESTLTLKVTSAGKKLIRKAGSKGLVVKLLSNPTLAGAPASAFKMTLVARR